MHGGGGFIDCNAIQNNTSVQRTEEKKRVRVILRRHTDAHSHKQAIQIGKLRILDKGQPQMSLT